MVYAYLKGVTYSIEELTVILQQMVVSISVAMKHSRNGETRVRMICLLAEKLRLRPRPAELLNPGPASNNSRESSVYFNQMTCLEQ